MHKFSLGRYTAAAGIHPTWWRLLL